MTNETISCGSCPLGRASGVGAGQFCPFVIRTHPPGAILRRAGAPADYVWFVKSGAVLVRAHADGHYQLVQAGEVLGLDSLAGGRATATLSAPGGATLCGATREGMREWLRLHREGAAQHFPALASPEVGAPAA